MSDVGARFILEAIRDSSGGFPTLENLNFSANAISDVGLRSFAELGPVALRNVERLDRGWNDDLMNDMETTEFFVQTMLLSDEISTLALETANTFISSSRLARMTRTSYKCWTLALSLQ
jgi:hypothetical protein